MSASCTKAVTYLKKKEKKLYSYFFKRFKLCWLFVALVWLVWGFDFCFVDALEGALEEWVEEMSDGLPNVLSKRIKCHVQNIKAHAKYTHNIVCPVPSSPLFFSAPLPLPF